MFNQRKIICGISLVLCIVFAPLQIVLAKPPLYVSVFPRFNASDTVQMYTPMIDHLAKELEREVYLVTARNFPKFWKALAKRQFHIVHFNQYHYIKSQKEFGYTAFAMNEEFGESGISASIITRKDSGNNTLMDLKGKKIVFGGGPKAMVSYILATQLLRRGGLKGNDYQTEFTKNPPNSILASYYGQAAAGGVGYKVLNMPVMKKKGIDISKMKFLAVSEKIAHLPWAFRNDMPDKLKTNIQNIFLSLNKTEAGKKILKQAALSGIHPARDSDYDVHRKIVFEVLGEKY